MAAKPKLSTNLLRNCTEPGRYFDTMRNGLFLLIRKDGGKQWLQRLKIKGKQREIGLGKYPEVSLTDARMKASKNQMAARDGIDPVSRRRMTVRNHEAGIPTFKEIALIRHSQLEMTFKNPAKQGLLWINTLKTYAFPHIGNLPVDEIEPQDIEGLLMDDNLWLEKCETARRVRQRIGDVMCYAVARGYRKDDPTKVLKALLPPQKKKRKPQRSLPYQEIPAALSLIRNRGGWPPVRLGLEFQILTATRPGEVRLARWGEIDREERTWTIPAEHTKMGRELIVPLSDQCLAILGDDELYSNPDDSDALMFPSIDRKKERPLSDMAFSKLMRDLELDAVPHGFRSSFRTWTQEQTTARDKVAEAALGHVNPNQVEGVYARSDYLDQRRPLMQMWADFVDGKQAGDVVRIKARGKAT